MELLFSLLFHVWCPAIPFLAKPQVYSILCQLAHSGILAKIRSGYGTLEDKLNNQPINNQPIFHRSNSVPFGCCVM